MGLKETLIGEKAIMIEKKVEQLFKWRKSYDEGKPEVPDSVFDALEAEVRAEDPDNEYFSTVGYTPTYFRRKVDHKVKMRSMQKK